MSNEDVHDELIKAYHASRAGMQHLRAIDQPVLVMLSSWKQASRFRCDSLGPVGGVVDATGCNRPQGGRMRDSIPEEWLEDAHRDLAHFSRELGSASEEIADLGAKIAKLRSWCVTQQWAAFERYMLTLRDEDHRGWLLERERWRGRGESAEIMIALIDGRNK